LLRGLCVADRKEEEVVMVGLFRVMWWAVRGGAVPSSPAASGILSCRIVSPICHRLSLFKRTFPAR